MKRRLAHLLMRWAAKLEPTLFREQIAPGAFRRSAEAAS